MRKLSWRLLPSISILALVLTMGPGALAQCGIAPQPVKSAVLRAPYEQARLAMVRLKQDGQSNHDDDQGRSIVGLWHLNYTATFDNNFPPGSPATPPFPFLESYKTWHADGTEFENAFLPPSGGNICFGAWKSLGNGGVKLHHIGLMFDPASGKVSNVFTVDEIDTVAEDGKTYSGNFDFKLFDATDVFGTGTPISEVKGKTAGTRITVD